MLAGKESIKREKVVQRVVRIPRQVWRESMLAVEQLGLKVARALRELIDVHPDKGTIVTVSKRPWLSMVVILHNMHRAAPRTLYSLSAAYQRGLPAGSYEVIVVDNGSDRPVQRAEVERFGPEFRLVTISSAEVSPVKAVNQTVQSSSGDLVGILFDGARMVSPGALAALHETTRLGDRGFVSLLGWHLGPDHQSRSISRGYNEQEEDRLLASVDWESNGYGLFTISSLETSNPAGWFGPVAESTCFATTRAVFEDLGGFDERFISPGGGLANHELLRRVANRHDVRLAIAIGEGTFHQLHGGVTTNSGTDRWSEFEAEYSLITGVAYSWPPIEPWWFGRVSPEASQWIGASVEVQQLALGNSELAAHARALESEASHQRAELEKSAEREERAREQLRNTESEVSRYRAELEKSSAALRAGAEREERAREQLERDRVEIDRLRQ